LEGSLSPKSIKGICSLSNPKSGAPFFVKTWLDDGSGKFSRCSSGLAQVKLEGKPDNLSFPHIRLDNPRLAYAKVVEKFFYERPRPFIAPTSMIDPSPKIGANVSIGHHSVIGPGVELDEGSVSVTTSRFTQTSRSERIIL
jgi:hypothetical protein